MRTGVKFDIDALRKLATEAEDQTFMCVDPEEMLALLDYLDFVMEKVVQLEVGSG